MSKATAPTGQPRAIGQADTVVAEACEAVAVEAVVASVVVELVPTVVVTRVVGIVVVTGAVVVVSVVVGPLVVVVVVLVDVSGKAGVAAMASTSAAAMPTIDPHRGIGSNRYRCERESLNRAQPRDTPYAFSELNFTRRGSRTSRMGQARCMDEQSRGEKPLKLTAAQTNRRIGELRRVFDEGFLSQDAFEAMKRKIEDRLKRPRNTRAR